MEALEIELIDHSDAVVVCLRGEMGLKLDTTEIAFNRVAPKKPPLASAEANAPAETRRAILQTVGTS